MFKKIKRNRLSYINIKIDLRSSEAPSRLTQGAKSYWITSPFKKSAPMAQWQVCGIDWAHRSNTQTSFLPQTDFPRDPLSYPTDV
ncbi:hypothetical protein SFRURICE_016585, partial [Spodoptera frugiperda]